MTDKQKTKDELIEELLALREWLAASGPDPAPAASRLKPPTSGDRSSYLLESLGAMMVEVDEKGHLVYVSPTVTQILGYQPEELLHRRGFDWIHEDDLGPLSELLEKFLASAQPERAVYRARHKLGHWVWLETTSRTYRTEEGLARTVAFTRDVTEAKRTGEALRESEERYQAIAANASDLIAEIDGEGRFLYVSPNCIDILGRPAEELVGRTMHELSDPANIHPEDRDRLLERFRRRIAEGGPGEIEVRLHHADGSFHWFESKSTFYRTRDGETRMVVIARDVTKRRQALQALRESEERHRIVAETSRDLIAELDAEGRLVYASPTSRHVLGFEPEEVVGTTPFTMVHPDDVDRCVSAFLEGLASGKPTWADPFRVRYRDASWRWLEGAGISYQREGGAQRFLAVVRDITERRRAEEERRRLQDRMQQAQKLESLGVMAGGIAHDFNNLLTPILGDASLALQDVPPDSPAYPRLLKIQRAAQRAAALIRQMLAYTGKESLHPEVLNLSQLVREMAQLLASTVSGTAVLVYELMEDPPPIEADAAQLSQIAMNLITNASEAIGEGRGEGRIAVRTGCVDADREYLDRTVLSDRLPEGRYLYFEVSDNGCGMDAETRERIFDPFFTTKFTGRGLGLAAVLGIVRGHRGAIEIESEPDHGTRFRVLFPESERSHRRGAAQSVGGGEWHSNGTILVVDDEEGVRDLTEETLKRCGLTVLTAADGAEGVRLFREHADEIRAVLLDRTMPSTSGERTFVAIRRIRPDARILLASGYSQQSTADHFAGKGVSGFLQKPFLPETLLEKIREVLGE